MSLVRGPGGKLLRGPGGNLAGSTDCCCTPICLMCGDPVHVIFKNITLYADDNTTILYGPEADLPATWVLGGGGSNYYLPDCLPMGDPDCTDTKVVAEIDDANGHGSSAIQLFCEPDPDVDPIDLCKVIYRLQFTIQQVGGIFLEITIPVVPTSLSPLRFDISTGAWSPGGVGPPGTHCIFIGADLVCFGKVTMTIEAAP